MLKKLEGNYKYMAIELLKVITSPQELTADWVQLGTFEAKSGGYSEAELFITLTRNDSTGIQFRIRERIESGGTNYPFNQKDVRIGKNINKENIEELDENASTEDAVKFLNIVGTFPFLIIEVKATVLGATKGTIDTAYFNSFYQV